MATGAGMQQTGQAGEHYVAAELCRRGAYAVTFSGNIPNFDIISSNREQTRAIQIQVKTKRTKGAWQASITQGRPRRKSRDEIRFWILVDMSKPLGELPDFYIMPEYWIQNDIHKHHTAYLAKHGGKRPSGSESKHTRISMNRVEQWKGRWDILGVTNDR
jgi:hypothetical protein